MEICVEKNDLNLFNLFAFLFAETIVNSDVMCIFDAWKCSKYQQILVKKD
jgi:hypothetical protein